MLGTAIDFRLPEAAFEVGPPEERGLGREQVRLMVARRSEGAVEHRVFADLSRFLHSGDALVINVSATLPAALEAHTEDGTLLRLHLASPTAEGLWSMEVRTPAGVGSEPGPELDPQTLLLPEGARVHLLARNPKISRLWVAAVEGIPDLVEYLYRHGQPIRYQHSGSWPLSGYQTVFARVAGSAEMPSAGRPFTTDMVTALVAKGVAVVPIILHTGISSYEEDETPGPERYEVPESTARVVNTLREAGGRVVAVGTTVVRALETVTDSDGRLHPGRGATDVVITPDRGVRGVDGLLTGWHEPRSSHLLLLETVVGRELLDACYRQAVEAGYRWHEFGDSLLILP